MSVKFIEFLYYEILTGCIVKGCIWKHVQASRSQAIALYVATRGYDIA